MKFKAILMDNDGTLMDFKAAEYNAIRSVLNILNITASEAPDIYSRINDQCWKDFERRIITQEELRICRFKQLIEWYHCKPACSVEQIAEAYVNFLSQQSILLPGALEVVKKISKHLPIIILTNGIAKVQHGRIDHSEIAPYLSGVLISSEIGAPKPAPDMYLKALDIWGAKPNEVLMIGDSLTSDIQGAVNLNIPTCWYNPGHKVHPGDLKIDYEIDRIEQMTEVALL